MNETRERLLDLLSQRAIYGLNDSEQKQLDELMKTHPEFLDDDSFELTVAYVNLASLGRVESMPDSLKNRILADAENFFIKPTQQSSEVENEYENKTKSPEERNFVSSPRRVPFWQKLGWAFAAVAFVALAINIWQTRVSPPVQREYVRVTPTPTPSFSEQRAGLLAENDIVKSTWSAPTPTDQTVSGDVVWSDAAQHGFARINGLPVNDKSRETYQLWVFEEGQGDATPVNAGTFDVNAAGEVVFPLDAEIKIVHPKKFAVTVEKPGGVVVSKLKKIAAVAKVET